MKTKHLEIKNKVETWKIGYAIRYLYEGEHRPKEIILNEAQRDKGMQTMKALGDKEIKEKVQLMPNKNFRRE